MRHKDNLVWIDLEMTGLDYRVDTILEIALIITDKNLNIIHEGPELVIHQPEEVLEKMDDWCKNHHGKTGLTKLVQESSISLQQAEAMVLETIKEYCLPQSSSLCGNTIWQDRMFLQEYMPTITKYLHYRLIDVTTVKRLVKAWYPKHPKVDFKKKDNHRALSDIQESIAELRHYRTEFFVP